MIKRAGIINDPKWREHWQRVYEADGDAPTIMANMKRQGEQCIKMLEEPQAIHMDRAEEKDNYVAEPRVYDAYNHREIDSDKIGTLTSASFHGSGNTGTFYVQPAYRIRKLTEKECFRLMGVKDEDSERVHRNQSKSSMYHLAGDSIVTACLMGLFGEMFDMDWQSKVRELQDDLTHETRTGTESNNDH